MGSTRLAGSLTKLAGAVGEPEPEASGGLTVVPQPARTRAAGTTATGAVLLLNLTGALPPRR
jgi:hypothetical protein